MKTNIMAIVAATFAMIMTSATTIKAENSTMATPISAPSVVNEVANFSKCLDYYYVTADGENNRFEYTLDKKGRVTSKVMYRQEKNGEWTPRCIWKVCYGKTINVLSFAAWDSKACEFSRNAESYAYSTAENPVILTLPKK